MLLDGSYHGRGGGALAVAFSFEGLYTDGFNLYQYLSSNPMMRHDPFGLADDPFAIVDDFLVERAASIGSFLTSVGQGATAATYVGLTVLSMLPFPITAVAADIGASVLEGHVPPELVAARRVIGVVALGGISLAIAKIGYKALRYTARYIAKHGIVRAFLDHTTVGLAVRAMKFAQRKLNASKSFFSCGCFTGMTLVWTPAGAVPIADIRETDEVYSAPEDGAPVDLLPAAVAKKIVIGEASLILLTVRHADGSVETISTTDEHPFHVADTGGWARSDSLQIGSRLSAIKGGAELLSVAYTASRVPVYNLSIPATPTYFVGAGGLWVHNCSLDDIFTIKYQHFAHRKGWDVILGKANPKNGEIGDAIRDIIADSPPGTLQPNGVTHIDGVYRGHDVYVQIFARPDTGVYEVTSAGLRRP